MIQEKMVREFIRTQISRWLNEDLPMMVREFPARREQITASLSEALGQLCHEARLLQDVGCKGPAAWLSLSFLRTNILDNLWQYRINLYDENFYLDRIECSVFWHMDFAWDYMQKRLDAFAEIINAGIYTDKIRTIHLDTVKLAMAKQYHHAVVDFTKIIIRDAVRIRAYADLVKAPNLKVIMGEYLDQSMIIYVDQPEQEKNRA